MAPSDMLPPSPPATRSPGPRRTSRRSWRSCATRSASRSSRTGWACSRPGSARGSRPRGSPASPSFTSGCSRSTRPGWGTQLLIDLSTVNHTAFFREPAHFTFMAERVSALALKEAPVDSGPDLVGGLLVRPGAVQHGDGPGRDDSQPLAARVEIWAATSRWRCSRWPPGDLHDAATSRGSPRPGSAGSSSAAGARATARSGSSPRSATWSSSATSTSATTTWPVPTDFHVIFCRNVSIYFAEDERLMLLNRLAQHLRPGGWLAMGNGEILPAVPASLRKHSPSIYRKEA